MTHHHEFEILCQKTAKERAIRHAAFVVEGQRFLDVDRHLEITRCAIVSGLPSEDTLEAIDKTIAWCQARLSVFSQAGTVAMTNVIAEGGSPSQSKAAFAKAGMKALEAWTSETPSP